MALISLEQYISKAQTIHCGRYDYSATLIVKGQRKITVICKNHGPFEVCRHKHIQSHITPAGCPHCAREMNKKLISDRMLTTERFVELAKSIHGDSYDYSLSDYKGNNTPLEIVCKRHGSFWQRPSKHLGTSTNKPTKCPSCSHVKNTDSFVQKAKEIHGGETLYDYRSTVYVRNNQKVDIICRRCNKPFLCTPNNHLRGHGCPHCNVSVGVYNLKIFERNPKLAQSPGWVYIFDLDDGVFKVGITKGQPLRRFSSKHKATLVFHLAGCLLKCFLLEQICIKKYKEYAFDPTSLKGNGATECFKGISSISLINEIVELETKSIDELYILLSGGD